MKDATQTGVSAEATESQQTEEAVETQETELSPNEQLKNEIYGRNKVVEDLAARFHAQRLESLGLTEEPEEEAPVAETDSEEVEAVSAPEPAPPVTQPAPSAPDVPVYLKGGQYFTKLKVNGQEQEVPYERVRATMQKHVAADQRLQHATDLLRKAEERDRVTRENETRLRQRVSQPPQGAEDTDEDLKAVAQTVINKLLDGEAEQAADDLVKMIKGRRAAPAPDIGEIEQRATARALETIEQRDFQKDIERGNTLFVEKYPEIMADPDLFLLADQKTIEIREEFPYLSPSEVMLRAGEEVVKKFVRRPAEPTAATSAVRNERKQGLKPMPRPASARKQAPAPQAPPMSTKESYLAEIRKARGQGR